MKKHTLFLILAMFAHGTVLSFGSVLEHLLSAVAGGGVVALFSGVKLKELKVEMTEEDEERKILLTALIIISGEMTRSQGDDKVVKLPGSDQEIVVPADMWKKAEVVARSLAAKSQNPADPTGADELPRIVPELERVLREYRPKDSVKNPTPQLPAWGRGIKA